MVMHVAEDDVVFVSNVSPSLQVVVTGRWQLVYSFERSCSTLRTACNLWYPVLACRTWHRCLVYMHSLTGR